MSKPLDLLQRPCTEAVTLLALHQLSEAEKAAARLEDPGDAEALHDFRVAIRRMRSIAKAWREELRGRMRKRDRQALRSLQLATGDGRDAEVALEWLGEQRERLSREQAPGLDWIEARLGERLTTAMTRAREEVRSAFAAQDAQLRADLASKSKAKGKPRSYRKAVKRSLMEHAAAVLDLLSGGEAAHGEARLHEARIAVKRLRYLTEPLRAEFPAAIDVVKACKRLQDLLGDINDAHVQLREFASRIEDLGTGEEAATLVPGLEALQGLAGERLASLHADLDRDWLRQDLRRLREATGALEEQLGRKS